MSESLDELKSSGISILNWPSPHAVNEGEGTVIVVGVPRSGTSMVAACLRALGIFMGAAADSAVHEDVEIARAIENNQVPRLRALVEQRDRAHRMWGFKRPDAFLVINDYLKHFRKPRLVIPFRDPVAIAKRNEISMRTDFLDNLRRASSQSQELVEFVRGLKHPVMVVSYEKAILGPKAFASALASFCGLEAEPSLLDKAAASIENGPESYLRAARIRLEGGFGGVENGIATGWARRVGQTAPLTVLIKKGDATVGAGVANIYRPDIEKLGTGDARCGFRIALNDTNLRIEDVTARIQGYVHELPKAKEPSVPAREET